VGGGGHEVKIVEIRKLNNERHSSLSNSVLDIRGICPTIDTMSGGNREPKILEPMILTPKRTEYGKAIRKAYESGKVSESRHNMTELQPRTDGISNTLTTVQKDNLLLEPIVVASRGRNPQNPSDRTAGNYVEQRLEPNSEGICNTLTSVQKDNLVLEPTYRIRKLIPLECWRLMDFTDEDFRKAESVNSNSQLYKEAGNSIVKAVLMGIFRQLTDG
jgi:DNA (cytosine-5)-methyltransferase 1